MTDNGKQVLLVIDNVRVIQSDERNVAVERLEPVTKKDSKETVNEWVFKGYYANLQRALLGIDTNGWLVNKEAISDLQTAIRAIEESRKRLLAAVGG